MPCENSLVVAWELFGWSMWDIVPWSGLEPRSPPLRVWSLSHWTTKEVPIVTDINHNMIHLYGINSALTWVVFYAATVNVHWPFSLLLQFYFYDCIPVDLRAKKKKKRLKSFTVTPTDWVLSRWNRWKECSLAMPSRILLCSRDLTTGQWVLDRGVPVLDAQLQEVRGCGRIPWGLRISRSSAVAKLSKWSPLRPMQEP